MDLKQYDSTETVLRDLSDCLYISGSSNSKAFNTQFDSLHTEGFHFKIVSVDSLWKDSAIVTIDGGLRDGLFQDSKGGALTSYYGNSKETNRANQVVGNSFILSALNNTAKAKYIFFGEV